MKESKVVDVGIVFLVLPRRDRFFSPLFSVVLARIQVKKKKKELFLLVLLIPWATECVHLSLCTYVHDVLLLHRDDSSSRSFSLHMMAVVRVCARATNLAFCLPPSRLVT